jgi:hypothetical protein
LKHISKTTQTPPPHSTKIPIFAPDSNKSIMNHTMVHKHHTDAKSLRAAKENDSESNQFSINTKASESNQFSISRQMRGGYAPVPENKPPVLKSPRPCLIGFDFEKKIRQEWKPKNLKSRIGAGFSIEKPFYIIHIMLTN